MTRTRLRLALAALLVALLGGLSTSTSPSAVAAPAPISGSGSTYVGVAMRQWVAQGQSQNLRINWTPVGSPTGMNMYNQAQVDFAATEAEFSSLALNPSRGYQYVPDVAGATAIMYNITETSGRKVDYLHLDRKTVARIFIGKITRWSDPAISATNKGIKFPDQPIRVVLRGNASGTTALFYDFIAKTLGSEYDDRFREYQCGAPDVRPVLIQCTKPGFIASTVSFNDSDQIAQYIAGDSTGRWSIGFDEFAYAKIYKAPTSWIQNAAGKYVLPYAQNISAALESARLRPDLSQDLGSVYNSTNAAAYPISAYSYLVTQCATSGQRPTCKGPYPNAGQSETLAKWMSFIACGGQITMAAQGYSPLPPNLSQEMANSVARLTGTTPVTLTAANCANPRFKGSLGSGAVSPCDPFLASCTNPGSSTGGGGSGGGSGGSGSGGSGSGGSGGSGSGGSGSGGSGGSGTSGAGSGGSGGTGAGGGSGGTAGAAGGGAGGTTTGGSGQVAAPAEGGGAVVAIGGGSDAASWRDAAPAQFSGDVPVDPFSWLPALLLMLALVIPVLIGTSIRRR